MRSRKSCRSDGPRPTSAVTFPRRHVGRSAVVCRESRQYRRRCRRVAAEVTVHVCRGAFESRFIELATRRVHLAGCTTNLDGAWGVQQARNFTFHLDERAQPLRFLIHDRDAKFCGPFDEVFATEGLQVVRTPIRAPCANAISERWIRTVRTECLDWLLIFFRRHLGHVLRIYIHNYNRQRPHRALQLQTPEQGSSRGRRLPLTRGCVGEIDLAGCYTNTLRRQHDGTEFVHPSGFRRLLTIGRYLLILLV